MSERAMFFWLMVGAVLVARTTLGYIRACLRVEDPKYLPPNPLPAFILGASWLDFAPVVHLKNLRRWRGRTAPAATLFYGAVAAAVAAMAAILILNVEMEP